MSVKPFEPRFMKIGVLTAALQELTPREIRDPDPDRAIEDWVAFARDLGAENIQLSSALHPSESDIPAEAMLDPVANTLDLRQPFNKTRANRVLAALAEYKIGLSDLGYFDNMLHDDPSIRKKKHEFMVKVFDAAALLGVDCGLWLRRPQSETSAWTKPGRLQRESGPLAQGGQSARTCLSHRAVSHARLDHWRQLP
jgi:sugar phosphate isomerase/epimerase